MALQASGAISLAQIQTEFGGSNPASLNEYYRNGSYVPYHATSIPTSGAIDFADFYSASNALQITLSTQTDYSLAGDLLNNHGWNGSSSIDVILTIPSGVTISATSTATPAIVVDIIAGSTLIINNSGTIVGKGGAAGAGGAGSGPGAGANGGDGGHAISFKNVTATVGTINDV